MRVPQELKDELTQLVKTRIQEKKDNYESKH